jgi:hypothetical protein
MAITKNGNWVDPRGREVPVRYVPALEKKRDALVEKLFKQARKIEDQMLVFKALLWEEIEKYVQSLTEENGVSEGWKGNLTLTSFSGNLQVEVDVKDLITFDERLNIAKTLIDECIKRWAGESNQRMKALVEEAFNVDKKGKVNSYLILRLTKLDMHDEQWDKAIQLIRESIKPTSTRKYVVFKYRESPDVDWQTMNLNFSSI